ncbi:hypothetical protein Pla123a_36940 [Posidoniimonas polymericola]|uniref:Dockerin domain-containing protein n=1 Tax=Posidoniimonas polymericola TaxID=2528002 RepID=A0A5C5YEN5_9BACT|nr:hypothetical protein [Posidoniimonas polymericola]TWT73800.1 hypothetical protein Pla123a_36940 [Posidoniimonas polymericola]
MQKIVAASLLTLVAGSAAASYVQPFRGGAQVTAPMKHADTTYYGSTLSVRIDESVPVPLLRALNEPDEFDPAGTWGMLNGSQYNSQYGWNFSRVDAYPPVGAWFWIEQLDASPGLRAYEQDTGKPIFGTDGSSPRWRWSGVMMHNLYAIERPRESELFASYRMYIGYDATGEPVPDYTAAEVTFAFLATPPLPGDYNNDGVVDALDYAVWSEQYGAGGDSLAADGNGDRLVDVGDYTLWRDHQTPVAAAVAAAAPEPVAFGLLAWAVVIAASRRPRNGGCREL